MLRRIVALLVGLAVLAGIGYPLYLGLVILLEPVTSATCPGSIAVAVDTLFGVRDVGLAGGMDMAVCALAWTVRLAVPTVGLGWTAYRVVR